MQFPHRHILLLIVGCIANAICVFAQPNFVNAEVGATLFRTGYNAGGATAYENIDSVTINSTTKYYLMPDASVNSGFNYATSLFLNVSSTFNWTVPALSDAGAQSVTGLVYPHYKKITWDHLGLGTLSIVERSTSGCDGNAVTTDVRVIEAPDVTAVTIGNVTCVTGIINEDCPDALLTVSSVVKGNKGLIVSYTLTGPSGFGGVSASDDVANDGTLNLSGIKLNKAGAYTLTITKIIDRIASKCGLPDITVIGVNKVFYVTVSPKTSKTQHVKNSYAW